MKHFINRVAAKKVLFLFPSFSFAIVATIRTIPNYMHLFMDVVDPLLAAKICVKLWICVRKKLIIKFAPQVCGFPPQHRIAFASFNLKNECVRIIEIMPMLLHLNIHSLTGEHILPIQHNLPLAKKTSHRGKRRRGIVAKQRETDGTMIHPTSFSSCSPTSSSSWSTDSGCSFSLCWGNSVSLAPCRLHQRNENVLP